MNDPNLDARILDDVADALISADRSGTIMRWNRASTALFGYSAEEALGQSLDLIIPEHLRAAHWKAFDAALESGTMKLAGRPTLTRAAHKDGRRLYIEMTFALVKDGRPCGGLRRHGARRHRTCHARTWQDVRRRR
jgi:PAS domain S-box-containing protein